MSGTIPTSARPGDWPVLPPCVTLARSMSAATSPERPTAAATSVTKASLMRMPADAEEGRAQGRGGLWSREGAGEGRAQEVA